MFRRLLMFVFCGALVTSCFEPPEYPDIPEITFKSVQFKKGGIDGEGNIVADTVVLMLNFKDGNGDIGVSPDEVYPPFNDRWYYTKSKIGGSGVFECNDPEKCWYYSLDTTQFKKYIKLSDRKKPEYATLEDFSKPYNCINWQKIEYDHDKNPETEVIPLDTIYFKLNPHYNNIFVQFEIKNDNPADPRNPFDTVFDESQYFTFPLCGIRPFNGRIPILFDETTMNTPLEGTIRYTIPSVSFPTIFGSKVLRLRVYIEDRALNKSNEIVTSEFDVRD